ncbi:MAG: hypothetical protein U0232_15590 [Thermomicrobiales bacterium]
MPRPAVMVAVHFLTDESPSRADAIAALGAALQAHSCRTVPDLMREIQIANGVALLAHLGCAGNPAARWEDLTYDIAGRLLPTDDLTPLIADWPPSAAMQEFGARALAAGADPTDPTLSAEAKGRILSRLSRPAQVAFETYALAREVAVAVSTGLRGEVTSNE